MGVFKKPTKPRSVEPSSPADAGEHRSVEPSVPTEEKPPITTDDESDVPTEPSVPVSIIVPTATPVSETTVSVPEVSPGVREQEKMLLGDLA